MDALTAIATVYSLLNFSATTLLLVQNFVRSADTLRRIEREITVLQHILAECVEIVTSQSHPTPLPQSLERTLMLCHEDHLHLLRVLERFLSKKRPILRMLNITFRDEELLATYHSFRDSVLLLRDLSSDLRLNRQLLQVSAEIALLLLDPDGCGSDEEASSNTASGGGAGGTARPTNQGSHSTNPRNRRVRLERFNRDLANLLASDFTRDLIIIFETDSTEPSERFQWVPLRNKIDTYSDENFISHNILDKYDMKQGKIRAIPEDEQRERELTMLGGYKLKPQREITLEWYRPKDSQKRETTFIIAENNPPFDT